MSGRKLPFRPVEARVDFVEMEKGWLREWDKSGLVGKYLQKNRASKKCFSFLDGPITANNPMGVHHAWGRTYKDIWQRYKNMQGFRQRFQNGFDCQGLWVEVEVERELGLKSKKDIENLVPGDKKASIAKFVDLCKKRVYKYSKIQTEQSKRLGYFMDWGNSYYTLSDDNNYMIWHFLKKCYESGLIYKGRDSVPWCPRCGTALSQHEMLTEDYQEVTHESVYVKYPILGRNNEFLLVWTTTPWTLPANVAIAVDEDIDYVEVTDGEKHIYYLAKSVVDRLALRAVKTVKGGELVGLEYESPFDDFPRVRKSLSKYSHRVVATDARILPVSDAEGTGLVHVAPGAGSEDFQLGKKLGLPVVDVIDEEAGYLEGLGEFSGKNAKNHPEIILDYLRRVEKGKYFFDVEKITHRYPACWRCKSELVWRVVDEWYIAMDCLSSAKRTSLREELKRVARRVNWIPGFGLKRELDWLDNMHDWLISKKRYWGLALPIWECGLPAGGCGSFEVIGGKDELRERAVSGWKKFEGNSPHRPWVDEIKIKCPKCGGLMDRVPDVGNPWLDAGIVPFSTISKDNKSTPLYWTDKKEWRKWFPAEFITESFPGQFKNWFYVLLVMSAVLEGQEPFRTVLGFATLLGEDGRPMHKSWGNSVEFNEGADKIGVDIMRWIYAKQNPEQNLLFGYKTADEARRRFYLILWNSYKFFVQYANLAGWDCRRTPKNVEQKLNSLDRWVLAKLTGVTVAVNENLEKYDAATAAGAIQEFIVEDLSTWYIRRSRERVGPNADKDDEGVFLAVLYGVLVTTSKLLAPFMPFVAEEIYTNLVGEGSVHLSDYPKGDKKILDEKLVAEMEAVRIVASAAHAGRKEAGIPVRQPLESLVVFYHAVRPREDVLRVLCDEVNVKRVEWEVKKGAKEPRVTLDTKITPELYEEGKTRELARSIQEERRKAGVPLRARVSVELPWAPSSQENLEWLKKRVLAKKFAKGTSLKIKVLES